MRLRIVLILWALTSAGCSSPPVDGEDVVHDLEQEAESLRAELDAAEERVHHLESVIAEAARGLDEARDNIQYAQGELEVGNYSEAQDYTYSAERELTDVIRELEYP